MKEDLSPFVDQVRLLVQNRIKDAHNVGPIVLFTAMEVAETVGGSGSEKRATCKQLIQSAAAESGHEERKLWRAAELELDRGMDEIFAHIAQNKNTLRINRVMTGCCIPSRRK